MSQQTLQKLQTTQHKNQNQPTQPKLTGQHDQKNAQSTMNYDLFKKHPSNTPINDTIVNKLVDSIQQRNMLSLKPILVNEKMQVLDGQHRLEAAKKLNLPVYYIVEKEAQDMDMILLNANQRTWKLADYHNFFLTQGSPEYRKLDEFTKNHKMNLQEYMKLDNYGRKSVNSNNFRHGKFVMPNETEQTGKLKIWNFAKELIQFIGKRRSDIPQVLKSVNFQRALISFLKRDDISLEEVRSKVEMKIDILGARSGMGGYYQMFMEIYNFRRRDPIA